MIVKQFHIYTHWFKTTACNVFEGWLSRDEGFAVVTVGNQVLPLNDKGVFFVSLFFPGSFKRKKAGLFNWQLQSEPLSAPFSDHLQQSQKKSIISCIMVFEVFKIGNSVSPNPTALQHINDMAKQTLLKFNNDQQLELTKQPVTLVS